MARESQGLQVLLIIFVMLCVVLGVTLYLKIKTADEATKAAVAANQAKQQAEKATEDVQKERDILKTLIGMPDLSTEEISKKTAEYMQTYGNAKQSDAGDKPLFDPSTLHYARLLESMFNTIQLRSDELIHARAAASELETRYRTQQSQTENKIVAINESETKLSADIKKIADDYTTSLAATQATNDQTVRQLADVKAKASRQVAAADVTVKEARSEVLAKEADLRKIVDTARKEHTQEMDVPSGEITWVSLPNKMVWINRGQADSLQRQTKFTVYSADSTMGAKAVKKGTVEVTRIEGAHSSQARILDDKLADPIMTGDKVFTPLWSPGQQNHFALTGIMNLDGDGHNQLSVVRGLIRQNGGEVDCELDEQGHKQGQITADTRFLVLGDAPDKSSPEFMKNHGDILRDADRYKLQTMKLSDFKQQMGYQKSSSVEHFGSTTSSSDVSRAASAMKAGKAAAPKAAAKSDESAP